MEIKYKIINKDNFDKESRAVFSKLLEKQGKVIGPYEDKLDRCKIACIAYDEDSPVAIGAIKVRTGWDFKKDKSGLVGEKKNFEWELGYLYTTPEYEKNRIAKNIVARLIQEYGDENLMASTEYTMNPGMVHILESFGFEQKGKVWKSIKHNNDIALFLKYKKQA